MQPQELINSRQRKSEIPKEDMAQGKEKKRGGTE